MVDFPYKVLVPQRPTYLVSRSRLNELLSIIADRRLITLSAPAGYGKTSLLVDFAATSPLPLCWYALDSSDRDPWVFLDYLAASIEHRFPGATRQTAEMLAGHSRTSFAAVLGALTRDLYTLGQDFVVVLDDWHLVDQVNEVSEVVAHLLLRCPHCHLILASRTYPSLPNLMLLTARRQMSSLGELQLRFNAAEVGAVLCAEGNTSIPDEQIAGLTEQANGWITGILLSLETTEPFALSPALPGTSAERQVYRYLAEQVFDEQPPEVREFLLDSVLLEEITPQHCDAIFQRTDSRRLLETLLRRHLFVTEIKPGVLRYHPLFREFLQEHYRTIDPERYSRVALQVADLYATQGQWLLAFDHYVEAGNLSAAQRVIAAGGKQLYTSGRLETLEHWFARVPVEDLNAELLCLKARVLLDRGRHHEAQTLAQLAETRMQPGDEPMVMLLQAQLARIAGRYEYALDVAQRVLDLTEDLAQRSAALRTIAICHHRLGQTACAIDELQKALAIERQRGDLHAMAELQRDLGICHTDIGLLAAAEAYYTQADSYWATIGNIGLRSMSLNSKGGVQHLVGRYQEAHATLITALQYARESSLPYYQAAVLSNLGDLYADLQLWDRASTAYNDARSIGGSAYLMSCLDISEIGLLIRQRQFEDAARALRQLPEATERRHPGAVLLLKATIACGLGHYLQAARDVQQALEVLEQTRGLIDLARAYVLQAQIAAATRPADEAALVAPLEQATAIANQVGHDAFLVAETLGMRSVLRRAAGAGWVRADEWLQRHQDMRLAAQVLEQDDQRPVLVVRTFGRDQIMLNGQPVELGWQKAREVLYYLLAHPDGALIDTLREAIWPNLGAERSRDTLRSAIYQLRSVLPRDLIALHGRQIYQINRDVARIDCDVERFLQSLDTYDGDSEGLSEALDLYRGLYLPSTDNEWCVALRTHLEQRYLQALHLAAEGFEGKHMYLDALAIYQRILALDNLDEAAHTGVMRSQIALGNRAAAINQYHTLRRILDDELGLEPGHSSAVEQLYRELLAAS